MFQKTYTVMCWKLGKIFSETIIHTQYRKMLFLTGILGIWIIFLIVFSSGPSTLTDLDAEQLKYRWLFSTDSIMLFTVIFCSSATTVQEVGDVSDSIDANVFEIR